MSELGKYLEQKAGMQHWTLSMEKQVGVRVGIVLDDPMMLSVFQRFGAPVFRRSSIFHGLAKLLADNNVKGDCCFEVGTWNGLTAAVLSRHFKRVVTVDIAHNVVKHKILAHLGIKNVECIDIADNSEKAGIIKDRCGAMDCAYLDGNHAEDTEEDWALVRDCGRVIFHEVWPFQPPVWQLVNALPEYQVTSNGSGLAIWDGYRVEQQMVLANG